jgi:hypothetical protein
MKRPCLQYGTPTDGSRCPSCRARLKADYNSPDYKTARRLLLQTSPACWLCGEPGSIGDPLTADHTVAVVHGGTAAHGLRAAHRYLIMTIITGGVWGLFVWLPLTVRHKVGPKDRSVSRTF